MAWQTERRMTVTGKQLFVAWTKLGVLSLVFGYSGCFGFSQSFGWDTPRSHAFIAEDLRKDGKYEAAIAEYKLHMEARLNNSRRQPDENPYFYYLLIADCYIGLDQPDEARAAIITAKEKDVEKDLVISKLRMLGEWYEKRARLEEAISLYKEFRELDGSLFDYDIDRVHKRMIAEEDAKAEASKRSRKK